MPPSQAAPTPPSLPNVPQPNGATQPIPPQVPQSAPAQTNGKPTKPPVNPNTTQNTLQISEIRENMVVMRDGSFRAVVACKSINFDLMSSREREGVEYSYQNFLNSLYFPVQVF